MKQADPTRKLVLKFNAHPGTTFKSVLDISNALGVTILNVEDVVKSKAIAHKVVTIAGADAALDEMKDALLRVPAVTVKEELSPL